MKELSMGENPGELFLKYIPLYLNHKDIINLQNAVLLSKDKLFKTQEEEAIRIHNCQKFVTQFILLRLSTIANKGSLHHFFTEDKLKDAESFFDNFVKLANTDEITKEKLMSAMIKLF
jgi:hypothetical protein